MMSRLFAIALSLSVLLLSSIVVSGAAPVPDLAALKKQIASEKSSDKKCALQCTLESIGVYWACAGTCIAKNADPKCITVGCLAASKRRGVSSDAPSSRTFTPHSPPPPPNPRAPQRPNSLAAAFDTPCLVHCNKTKTSKE